MPTAHSPQPKASDARQRAKRVARSLLGQALGFRDCRADTLDALVEAAHVRELGKGEVLAQRGAPFDMLCVLVDGSIEASMLRFDGHRHLVNYLQPGDVVGMIGMIDGLGHVTDLSARARPATVLLIPGDVVRHHREHDPALARAFELQLAFRSRLLYERLASDSSMPLDARLARLLRILAGLYGLARPGGVQLMMKVSQADLGDWLGVTRQRANFAVQQLRKDGVIQLRYSNITITDPEQLEARALL